VFSDEVRDDVLGITVCQREASGRKGLRATYVEDQSYIHDRSELVDVAPRAATAMLGKEITYGVR
jgi:hypothetical protein